MVNAKSLILLCVLLALISKIQFLAGLATKRNNKIEMVPSRNRKICIALCDSLFIITFCAGIGVYTETHHICIREACFLFVLDCELTFSILRFNYNLLLWSTGYAS